VQQHKIKVNVYIDGTMTAEFVDISSCREPG